MHVLNQQEVKVTGCTGAGLRGNLILALIGQLCSHVTSVDVSWSGATDAGLRALINCKRLRAVVLSGCHVTDQALLDLLLRHTASLCKLEVFGCQSISSSCLEAIYEMCPNLQHLNIGRMRRVDAHSLTVLGSKLNNLRSLNVTGLQAVSDVVMEVVLQKCPLLLSLTLSQCPGVTDRTLHSISEFTRAIRSVDVSGCAAVTDAGVRSLARGCTRLQQLDLSSTATGDTGVALLAHHCRAHLHTVKLSFCRISPHSLLQLCQRCTRLEVLHVYGCAQLPTGSQIRRVNPAVVIHPVPPDATQTCSSYWTQGTATSAV
uniref:F-box/LRR-repeat protein 15-like leucin rich repeat domain-containing protein n=1 Tax=Neogobius melanostomus TaxID=47308 RepID=A0A8C6T933_9GOBI